jgi:hypothetical protein
MTDEAAPARPAPREREVTLRAVTVIMGTVVGLSFLFAFGNVWTLALRLGVPRLIAPLVAPAVDLSVVGLLLATRYLTVHGAGREHLCPARRLLAFATLVTLALNVAEPMIAGRYGKAAFDSVGCLILAGWAHVGPGLLQAISEAGAAPPPPAGPPPAAATATVDSTGVADDERSPGPAGRAGVPEQRSGGRLRPAGGHGRDDGLWERAKAEDARHWELHRRPISAETLRKRLNIGAARSRSLVAQLRAGRDSGLPPAFPMTGTSPAAAAVRTP